MNRAYRDSLVEDAAGLIIKHNTASASFLQRKLSIGYARAAMILDELESQGIVSPSNGATPREVLITDISKIKGLTKPKKLSDLEIQEKLYDLDLKVNRIIYALDALSVRLSANNDEDDKDALFNKAAKYAEENDGRLTITDIQNKFRIGYARSARIQDELTRAGVLNSG